MKSETGDRRLTAEEAAQLGEFLWNRRNVIRNCIKITLEPVLNGILDDCVNDVFVIALQKGTEVLNHPNPVGWLIHTAKNVAYNANRKYYTESGNVPLEQIPEVSSHENLFEHVCLEDWLRKRVPEELVSRLSSQEREVFEMLFRREMSYREIAAALHVTESTVRNIKKHIMDKLNFDVKYHQFEGL